MGYTRIPAATGVGAITNVGTESPIPIRDPATSWYHPIPGQGVIQNNPPSATAPSLSAADQTQSTGSYVVFDTVLFTATTADATDLLTTTSVDLYESGVLVGSMVQGPAYTWHYTVTSVSAGAKSYTARRHYTPAGIIDSAPVTFTALAAMAPTDITTATLIAWYRTSESIQMGTAMIAVGTAGSATVSTSSSLVGRTEGLFVKVTTGGTQANAKVDVSIDNGTTFPQTAVAISSPIAVTGTDLTITFGAATYTLNGTFLAVASNWLDKVGAYPSSTNNCANATVGTRPGIKAAGTTNSLGAACLGFGFDGTVDDQLTCTGSVGTSTFGGADKTYFQMFLTRIAALPSGANGTIWNCSNLTDTDLPYTELSISDIGSGDIRWRAIRRDDAGAQTAINSNVIANLGQAVIEDYFNGSTRERVITVNSADVIGGDSGVSGICASATITTTTYTLGCRQTQAGKSQFGQFHLYEHMVFNQRPSSVELYRLRAYLFT